MADIFDEIDEELKRDRTQQLWACYGKYVLAAAAAVVLAVGSAQGFKAWQARQAETAANAYAAALASDDVVAALTAVENDLTDGYAMLARFQIAAGKAAAGDRAGAEADYLALAADKGMKPLYKQAALLLAVMNAPDGADPAELQTRLEPLSGAAGPWQGMALEVSAALDLQAGDVAAARGKVEAILALPELSPELRQRANQLSTVLKP